MVKNPPANAEDINDMGSVPGLGRSAGGGHGNSLQYFCLQNPIDRRAWKATVHRVTKSWTRLKRLSTYAYTTTCSCAQLFYVLILQIFIYLLVMPYLSCGMRDVQLWNANSQLQHAGSSSLTRDQTQASCAGSVESQSLDHQGSLCTVKFKYEQHFIFHTLLLLHHQAFLLVSICFYLLSFPCPILGLPRQLSW